MVWRCLGALVLICASTSSNAQSFSCSIGTDPACLDYGAKVCKSFAKCVDQNAVCFDTFTCDYKGFICKSKLYDVVDLYESLEVKYNILVDDYNKLLHTSQTVEEEYEAFKACLDSAEDLSDAQACVI